MLSCSVGIMAYNEEKNITRLISAIKNQKLSFAEINEIVIVASGCTDRTEAKVSEMSKEDSLVRLITQSKREGKSSAINLWLSEAKGDILIMESADTLPEAGTYEKLLSPFEDEKIGMVGARPVPVNDRKTFWGFAAQLLWQLHHLISLEEPKMGETVAFRNIIRKIPAVSSVDEAEIEAIVKKNGYKIVYASEAIIKNKGPENLKDFLKQRRRIYAGHLALQKRQGYRVSTASGMKVLKILLLNFSWDTRSVFYTPVIIMAEACGRFLGWYDFNFKKKEASVWEIATSTKNIS